MIAADEFTISRRRSSRLRRLFGWGLAGVFASGGPTTVPGAPVWQEVLDIRRRSTGRVVATVKNAPGSVFDNVSAAEREFAELTADEFRTRWVTDAA
jgi:hypothetical protein